MLVVIAYTYLASAFIGMAITRCQASRTARHARVRLTTPRTPPTRSTAYDTSIRVYASGSVIVTVVPAPRSLVTAIVPPFSSTFRFAIVSPRPVPVAFVEKYGSKILLERVLDPCRRRCR